MGEVEAGYKVRKDEREDIKKKIERMKFTKKNIDIATFDRGAREMITYNSALSDILKILK